MPQTSCFRTPAACSDKTPAALFFRYNTQLGPPYQVIIDTNFINFSIRNKIDLVKVKFAGNHGFRAGRAMSARAGQCPAAVGGHGTQG
jgi:hypothetical protein